MNSRPLFRFTLSNDIEGTLQIHEPEGWDDGVLRLERNKDYHSLVEYYSQPLIFDDTEYLSESGFIDLFWGDEMITMGDDDITFSDTEYATGTNVLVGGMSYIKNIEETQGLNAIIKLNIKISEDNGVSYQNMFDGLIDIPSIKEIDFYKLECGVKRNDFWSKFINQKSKPVDIAGATDLDGNFVTPIIPITLPLPSQKIRSIFERDNNYNPNNESLFYPAISAASTNNILFFDNSRFKVDEISERTEYGNQIDSTGVDPTTISKSNFLVKYGGSYLIEWTQRYFFAFSASVNFEIKWFLAIKSEGVVTKTQIGATQTGSSASIADDGARIISTTKALNAGDEIFAYGTLGLSGSLTSVMFFPDYDTDLGAGYSPVYTSFKVTANTIFPDTESTAVLIGDAAESILSKITSVSNVLNDFYFSGCHGNYILLKGLHVRGYSFTEKPFNMSFDDWWEGANPILNLGLSYEDDDKIWIGDKIDLYDPVPILNLDFVNKIERSYETDRIYKSFEIGYQKWAAESDSGTDDPQSKRIYDTGLTTVGSDEKVLSKFYAASLGIEQTRRNSADKSKDWRLDDDTMIISINRDPNVPEFSENFSGISGLLNSDFRYNVRISAVNNLLRWRNYFNGCLQIPGGTLYKFRSGEGNYDMSSTLHSDDCDYNSFVSEKGNYIVTDDILCTPRMYEFEHPITYAQYKTILANRKKAIGISSSDSDHVPAFIMDLQYKPTHGLGVFVVLLGAQS